MSIVVESLGKDLSQGTAIPSVTIYVKNRMEDNTKKIPVVHLHSSVVLSQLF